MIKKFLYKLLEPYFVYLRADIDYLLMLQGEE